MKMVLKNMKIIVSEYDERTLILNDWVQVELSAIRIYNSTEMKKGISNYFLFTQADFDQVVLLNGEIRCGSLDFTPSKPYFIESMTFFKVSPDSFTSFCSYSFNKIRDLDMQMLSREQIEECLSRVNYVENLTILRSKLDKLDLRKVKVKTLMFQQFIVDQTLHLPEKLEFLSFNYLSNCNSVEFGEVETILVYNVSDKNKELNYLKEAKNVKKAIVNKSIQDVLDFLPSNIRALTCFNSDKYESNLIDKVKEKFKHLNELDCAIPVEIGQKLNLKSIRPTISYSEDIFTYRPRKIDIDEKNVTELSKHPELFKKLESIEIRVDNFDLDLLPANMKKVMFHSTIDLASKTINRLEEKQLEV